MASLPEPQFEEERDEFEAANLGALAALEAANSEVVDLDVAEKDIHLITDETRKKIKAELPNHELLFQRALAKERRNKPGDKGAFRRAFESVYGKFLFEEKSDDLEKIDGPFVVQLNKVLRFSIDDKTGFKGRSELQAAIRRLRLLSGSRDEVDVTLSGLRQQKTDTESRIAALRKTNAPIVYKLRKLDELHGVDEFDRILGRLERIEEMGEISKGGSNTLKSEKKPELRKQLDQRQSTVVECFEKIHSARASLGEINQTLTNYYPDTFNYDKLGISKLLADLDEFLNADDENFDIDRLEELFHKHLKPLSKKLSSGIFFRTLTDKVHGNPVLEGKIRNFLSDVQYLDGAIHKIREYEILLHDLETTDQDINDFEAYQTDNAKSVNEQKVLFFQQLNVAASAVQEFAKKNVPKDVEDECSRYLEESRKFITEKDPQTRTLSELRAFIQNVYKPFLDRLRGLLQTAKDANDGQLRDANNALLDLNTRITKFEDYQASNVGDKDSPLRILNKAFAGIDPLKIIELEREHSDAKTKEDALNEQYKYFSGKGPGETHEKFLAIKTPTSTRKDVRELEAKFKKAEDNKATLGNLKDLFSEAKTSALHDLFQELSVLESKNKDQKDDQDFDAEIAAESSLISILEKELTAELSGKKRQRHERGPTQGSGPDDKTQEKIDELKRTLHEKKLAVEKLKKSKANRDKFKEFAKKLRGELQRYCREYLVAFELGQNPTKSTKADVEEAKKKLDAINVEKGFEFSELETIYESLKSGFGETFEKVKARLEETDLTLTEKQVLEDKKSELDKAKALHTDLKAIVDRIKVLKDLGLNIPGWDVAAIITDFEAIKIDDMNFRVEDLTTFYSKYFSSLFENSASRKGLIGIFEKRLAELKDEVKNKLKAANLAKAEAKTNENLTDAQAAKRLIAAMVAEQNPDMSLPDQQKLASMILANDVATLQTEASYEELAKRGGAELLDTVRQAGFRRKLIGFQYKEGDKAVQPFKGLKPEQFNDWPEIERLFKIGRLNHQNGFFVLAAMKEFAPMADGQPIPQIQAVKLEKKLKAALAEELGVDERMDEAGIDKILNKALADQLKKAQELVKAYFQHFDRNVGEWNGNKIKELNLRYARVTEELRLGKINDATFQKRMAELVEEAKETEVLDQVKFSEDSAMAGYWNSPFSQWFRDRGWDVGQYAKGKAKSLALSGVKLGAFGLWGATKLGLSATLQTALLPLRAVKYPLLLAAKPLVGLINLFRSQKWTPLPRIRDAVRSDAGRVVGYFKTKGGETWKGAVEKGTGVPKAEWGKTPWATKKYSERTKVDLGSFEEQAKELKAKGDATPVEVAGSPFIDLKKYRDEIAKLDRILAQKPAEERGDSAADKRAA